MKITSLGNSDLKVTKLGLGLAALGRPGYINIDHDRSVGFDKSVMAMERNAHEVFDYAWANGIRYFDTARSYGKAELFLSSWLKSRNIDYDAITVSSKWGYVYTADWKIDADKHEVKYHTLENFKRQWVESKEILGSYINLYQIHSATLSSGVLENKVVLRALAQLKLEGIKVGLSLSGPEQKSALYKAMEIMVDGIRLFDSVQLTWNILENSTTEALKDAKREGIGVMVKEALANGRLYHYQHEASQLISAMEPIISSKKVSPDMVALAYVAQQDFVDTVLSGAATISHLESNLKISDFELARADVEALDGIYQTPDVYWQTRSRMEWN